ncbi:hypothetical protein D3C83_287310 [compost metagenome]
MKRVTERHHNVGEAARSQHSFDFPHHAIGLLHMFENGVALDSLELAIREWQVMGVCRDIHAIYGE